MRKLISIVLALVMVLSLCVTTTWADTTVTTAAGLKDAIENGTDTYIKLGADIVLDPTTKGVAFQVSRELKLDLNGHKIGYDQTKTYTQASADDIFDIFSLVSGAKMTVTGNGTVDATIQGDKPTMRLYSFCFRLRKDTGAELTIENGTFLRDVPATAGGNSSDYDVIFVHDKGGTVTINDGYFAITGHSGIVLNVAGNNYDGTEKHPKHIYMNGGTVVGALGNTGMSYNEVTPTEGTAVAKNDSKGIHYFGSKAIADAVNSGESVTVVKNKDNPGENAVTGGEINGVKGGSIKVANGVTGVKINGVEVANEAANEPTTIEVWKVSFLDGETVLSEVGVVDGQTVERPADPTKAGCIFVRWNDVEGEEYDFDTAVNSDLKLVAEWELAPHEHTRRQPTTTTTTDTTTTDTTTDVVTSAKTFDAGVAVYGVMAVLSLTGSAWVVGKKRG